MFPRLSSSRAPHTEIEAFAGGSKPHTILSIIKSELPRFLNLKTILSLRITCKEAKQSVDNNKHVYSNEIIDFTLPYVRYDYTLNIPWYNMITDADFQYLNGIHTLNIGGCEQITGAIFKHLHGLIELNMAGCTGITDEAFVHLKGIHMLNMSNCSNITDNAIMHLKGIHILNMYGCPNITDNAIMHLKGIYALNIIGCTKITSKAIGEHLQGIKYIYIPDISWYEDNGYYDFSYNRKEQILGIEYDKIDLEFLLPGTRVLEHCEWSYKHRNNHECDDKDVLRIMELY